MLRLACDLLIGTITLICGVYVLYVWFDSGMPLVTQGSRAQTDVGAELIAAITLLFISFTAFFDFYIMKSVHKKE